MRYYVEAGVQMSNYHGSAEDQESQSGDFILKKPSQSI